MCDYYERLLIKSIKIKAFIWRLTYHETKISTITVEKNLPTMDPTNNIQDTSYKMVSSKYILS